MKTAIVIRNHTFFPQTRIVPNAGACPLCHQAPPVDILCHIAGEQEGIGEAACEMIQDLHPEWAEQEGLCQQCWQFYVGLGRVLNFLRSPDAPQEANTKDRLTIGIQPKE